jgi:hypothetical protein
MPVSATKLFLYSEINFAAFKSTKNEQNKSFSGLVQKNVVEIDPCWQNLAADSS